MGTAARRFDLREDLSEQLSELARQTGRSSESLLEEAVEAFVRDFSTFDQEVEEGLASMDAGLAHSREQVFDWLDDFARGRVRPIPSPDVKLK